MRVWRCVESPKTKGRWGEREKRLIVRYLRRTGIELEGSASASDADPPEGFRYGLKLALASGGEVSYAIEDGKTGRIVAEKSPALSGGPAARCAALVKGILDDLYRLQ